MLRFYGKSNAAIFRIYDINVSRYVNVVSGPWYLQNIHSVLSLDSGQKYLQVMYAVYHNKLVYQMPQLLIWIIVTVTMFHKS